MSLFSKKDNSEESTFIFAKFNVNKSQTESEAVLEKVKETIKSHEDGIFEMLIEALKDKKIGLLTFILFQLVQLN